MKLQFDANQQYQLDAVAAVIDLFEQIDYKKGIKAKLRIHVQTPDARQPVPDVLAYLQNEPELAWDDWALLNKPAAAAARCRRRRMKKPTEGAGTRWAMHNWPVG